MNKPVTGEYTRIINLHTACSSIAMDSSTLPQPAPALRIENLSSFVITINVGSPWNYTHWNGLPHRLLIKKLREQPRVPIYCLYHRA